MRPTLLHVHIYSAQPHPLYLASIPHRIKKCSFPIPTIIFPRPHRLHYQRIRNILNKYFIPVQCLAFYCNCGFLCGSLLPVLRAVEQKDNLKQEGQAGFKENSKIQIKVWDFERCHLVCVHLCYFYGYAAVWTGFSEVHMGHH